MRPTLHPSLVNGRSGDPVLYVETLFEKHVILFDLGNIDALTPRQIQRIDHAFVSHAHMDHFFGFDRLLRVLTGREKTIRLYGPSGFADCVYHKLQGYEWNLAARYTSDLVFIVTEIDRAFETKSFSFRMREGFARQAIGQGHAEGGVLHKEEMFCVKTAVLDHRIPCLGFAVEETAHVNIWKNRVEERGLPIGPWLHDLKRAVIEQRPDSHLIHVNTRSGNGQDISLADLRDVYTITPGQKIGYVTDVADTKANREAIIALVQCADMLFIEAVFSKADAALAAERAHLTTAAAGEIARAAKVKRIAAMHFSLRYEGEEGLLLAEVEEAFTSPCSGP
jgi:ribonuclease Z